MRQATAWIRILDQSHHFSQWWPTPSTSVAGMDALSRPLAPLFQLLVTPATWPSFGSLSSLPIFCSTHSPDRPLVSRPPPPFPSVAMPMGTYHYIPDTTKHHVFVQSTVLRQKDVVKRFSVLTKTVQRVVKNVLNMGRVSHPPLVAGRTRELSWQDVNVCVPNFT